MADPSAPEAGTVAVRKQRFLAVDARFLRVRVVQTLEDRVRVRNPFGAHLRLAALRMLEACGVFRLKDQRFDTRDVAEKDADAQQSRQHEEPPAVEHVVEMKREDERRGPFAVRVAIDVEHLALRDETADHARKRNHDQQDDRKLHRRDETVDFLQNLHVSVKNAARNPKSLAACVDRGDYSAGVSSAMPCLISCSAVERQRIDRSELCAPSEFST